MSFGSGETTQVLLDLCAGNPDAADELTELVYSELKAQAANYLRHERSDHTLSPTALVNEAYLRLIDQKRVQWQGRAHFCAVAAMTMRRILSNHARERNAAKRGGEATRIPLIEELLPASRSSEIDVIELDDLLNTLAEANPRHVEIIELRFFAGLTIRETAHVLGVSPTTIKNEWRIARAWLMTQLSNVE